MFSKILLNAVLAIRGEDNFAVKLKTVIGHGGNIATGIKVVLKS